MIRITYGSVEIQTTSESNRSTPCWFGEVVLLTTHLRKHGVLRQISEQVRFVQRCFGRYEVIDFLAVLFGYAISGERTPEQSVFLRLEKPDKPHPYVLIERRF